MRFDALRVCAAGVRRRLNTGFSGAEIAHNTDGMVAPVESAAATSLRQRESSALR